jgi:hypothetical protein
MDASAQFAIERNDRTGRYRRSCAALNVRLAAPAVSSVRFGATASEVMFIEFVEANGIGCQQDAQGH